MKFDLEDRIIDYAVIILDIVEKLPNNKGANHLGGQLVRSGTAPALLYGEAQSAESRKDFIHKMTLALKELKESNISLKIIRKKGYLKDVELLQVSLTETQQLMSIFAKSILTAKNNLKAKGNSI